MTLAQLGNGSFLVLGAAFYSALCLQELKHRTAVSYYRPCAVGASRLTGKLAVRFMTTYHKTVTSKKMAKNILK